MFFFFFFFFFFFCACWLQEPRLVAHQENTNTRGYEQIEHDLYNKTKKEKDFGAHLPFWDLLSQIRPIGKVASIFGFSFFFFFF